MYGKGIVHKCNVQEARVLADKSQNLNSLKSILEGADSHSILAREVYPELKELSDDEIKKKHKDKRQIGKIANFTFAFGGNGYTAAKNLNIPISEGERIYQAYVKINKETFDWGETVLSKALEKGYIESADGFKLKLPFFDEYKSLNDKISRFSKEEWDYYKQGKRLYKESLQPVTSYEHESYDFYHENKYAISKCAKLKSQYFRLCLNNPKRMGA